MDQTYLTGLFAPVFEEMTADGLEVVGEIPRDLNGLFAQNGPNPLHTPNQGHSWFDGDGRVHGVHLDDGRATFRSRWIETAGLQEDRAAGRALYVGSMAKRGVGRRHKNVANTDLVHHAGRLLALWWEGGTPHELSLRDLKTLGSFEFGGKPHAGVTSHAKVDPKTGELFFVSWGPKAPFLHLGVANERGLVTRYDAIELPGPRIQHDIALSERYVCVFDFPLIVDADRPGTDAIGFSFDPERPARFGLLERRSSGVVRWFEVASCFMWHTACAWDEGDEFVLVGARIEHPTRIDRSGKIRDSGPIIDGEHRFDARAYQWRLNLSTGSVTEHPLDDAPIEFPRVNDEHICRGARFSYMLQLKAEAAVKCESLIKYDLSTGGSESLRFPEGHVGNEVSFAPRDRGSAEDDGYLVGFVTDERSLTSEFWITPARSVTRGPLARIKLPQKVPPKFHGRWVPGRY
jgi:carotenoid cleavage dioxygenase-like enzyme